MNIVIEKNTSAAAYFQVYQQIRDGIISDLYPFGTKLPSKRNLAAGAGISIITVEHAYDLLQDEGYIQARERRGYYVVFRPQEGFVCTPQPEKTILKHASLDRAAALDPELAFPFSVLAKTMRRVLSEYGDVILEKSPGWGCTELKDAIRDYLAANRGIYVDSSQIIVGSGAEYLYSLIANAFGRETVFGLESPSYKKIEQVYRTEGIKCELLPLSSDGIESHALQNTGANVLHISPYRSFPTGITAPASKRYEYIRWADRGNRYIIEDDFESEFSVSRKPEETLFSISKEGRVIYLNTFSRTISPSMRVGYMVVPSRLMELFQEKVGFYSCSVPTFEQYVLSELISHGDFERHINKVRRKKRVQLRESG